MVFVGGHFFLLGWMGGAKRVIERNERLRQAIWETSGRRVREVKEVIRTMGGSK